MNNTYLSILIIAISLIFTGCSRNNYVHNKNPEDLNLHLEKYFKTNITMAKEPSVSYVKPIIKPKTLIKTEYDEFTGDTVSTYSSVKKTGRFKKLTIIWQVNTEGTQRINEKSRIQGAIQSSSPSWRYLDCKELIFLIDGKRYSPPRLDHDGRVGSSVTEFIIYALPRNIASQISSARSVKARLCWNEFVLSKDDKKALSMMLIE